jgi:hypothetical protein
MCLLSSKDLWLPSTWVLLCGLPSRGEREVLADWGGFTVAWCAVLVLFWNKGSLID